MNRIWKRYFFKEIVKIFTLFILSFYFLYVLIDYSTHAKIFHNPNITWFNGMFYYLLQFIHRADILIPIALLVGAIKVLTTSQMRNEIVALTAGGISLKKILTPFFWAACFCTFFLYLNFECLQPFSVRWIKAFEEQHFHEQCHGDSFTVKSMILEDHSLLLYQSFHLNTSSFFDVFWLKDQKTIYRMKRLFPYESTPRGEYVDLLEINSEEEIEKRASHENLFFSDLLIDPKILFHAACPPQMQSITQLARRITLGHMNDREAEIATIFYYKITMPLLCFLVIMGPAPYCLRFTRHLPIFLIFALSLFLFLAYLTLSKSAIILGKNQVIPPIVAILLPQMTFFLVLLSKYAKL